ncbi:MAG TPA: succinate dehydrogenase cytochrome b subunit [Polyangiaceae bacterium]|nr:succinate dehydrogenase cytochrome b subunit [Polyangiaceae bacterium]
MALVATQKNLTLGDTSIGKKAVLAVSGIVLFGFVIVHMLGNLQVFLGPEVYNHYAEAAKANPVVLYGARSVLLVALITHIVLVVQLYRRTLTARPVGYRVKKNIVTSYAGATMKYSGPALLLYIIFHLAHFTYPGMALGNYEHSPLDVYGNFVNAFQLPWVTALYVTANLLLGMHLYHGAFSLLQSLGLNHPRYNRKARLGARAFAFLVTTGNIAMPLSVLFGVIR